jgi:hypothetical protein
MTWLGRCAAFVAVILWAQPYHWSKTVLTWLDPDTASQTHYGLPAVVLIIVALLVWRSTTLPPLWR